VAAGAELFATLVRSNGYNISVALFGGTTPYTAIWLVDPTGRNVAPTFYVIAAAVVTFATVLTMRETAGPSLSRPVRARGGPQQTRWLIADRG
jgi:MFS transporter, MHS family, proline/betaine transporter